MPGLHTYNGSGWDSNTPPAQGCLGGTAMAGLKEEYTDMKGRRHRVEHLTVHAEDSADRERVKEELFLALTSAEKRIPAS